MIKDVEPNKYVLEANKSSDPGDAPMTYFVNFGTPSITFEWKKLDTSFFFVRSAVTSTTQRTINNE